MAVTDMFKSTIDSFKSVGGGAYNAAKSVGGGVVDAAKPTVDAIKNVGGSAINTAKPYAGKVLAKLNSAKPMIAKVAGSAIQAHQGVSAIEDMFQNGVNGINATDSLNLAGAIPALTVPTMIGSVGGDLIAATMGKYGDMKYGGDNLTDASRAFAKTMQKDAKGNYIAPVQELPVEPKVEFPQESANKVADSFVDDIYGYQEPSIIEPPKVDAQQDSLAAIKETLAQAKTEREKVVNPLQQQSNMALQDFSNNPFAAVMQLQQAVGQLAPHAVNNKMAKDNAKNLTDDAKNQVGLVELENTLKNGQLNRDKAGVDIQEGKLKVEQSQRLSDSMKKLGTLDDTTDPKGDKRKALQENILTMLGKEPKDNYVIQEVGGGTDPATGLPLPKRAVVFDKSTGKIISDDANGSKQKQNSPTQQYKEGQKMQTKDGRVLTAVKDKDGNIQWDDGT